MSDRLLADGRRPTVIALMSVIAIASYNNLSAAAALPDIGDDLGDIGLLPFVITVELLTSAVAVLAAGPIVDSRIVYRDVVDPVAVDAAGGVGDDQPGEVEHVGAVLSRVEMAQGQRARREGRADEVPQGYAGVEAGGPG